MMRRRWLGGAVVLLLAAVAVWAAGVDGKWKADYQSPDGQNRQVTFTFRTDGGNLTGTAAFSSGEVPIQDGKVNGGEVSFFVMRNFGGDDMKFEYKGRATGDDIKFSVSVGGGDRRFDMTAKRMN